MKTLQIDVLNTGLILISFCLAYWLPFELFLLAYAILGPLHYFTEINWIRDKNYFVTNSKFWMYGIIVFSLLLSIPVLLRLPFFADYQANSTMQKIMFVWPTYLNSCFFIAITVAIAFTIFKKKVHQYLSIALGILLAVLLHKYPLYHVIFGILVPTVIHVYIFTLLFMWYGNLTSKSKIGYVNIILMVAIPFIIASIGFSGYRFSMDENIINIYRENSFHALNANVSKILGLSDGTTFSFSSILDTKVQMFISFAYTYHYLNWFSKTTIIGWHKKLTQKRSLLIIILWLASVLLYFYNYRIGLTLLLFLSLLHVFMEFPLNVISIKAIGNSIFNPKKT